MRALVVVGDTTQHLHLFDDLLGQPRIDLVVHPNGRSVARKALARLSPSAALSVVLHEQSARKRYDRIVVLDSALSRLDPAALRMLRRMSGDVQLVLLNSIDASSLLMAGVRGKLGWFDRDDIHTFDTVDAAAHGFRPLPPRYYSARRALPQTEPIVDAYFVGGMKGGRDDLVVETFAELSGRGVDARFDCTIAKHRTPPLQGPGLHWRSGGWEPYDTVLGRSAGARCLVEILQQGQHAQSARYFESVVLNRLLLTTNERVVDLPFYDPRFMRVFQEPYEIDVDWMRSARLPRYAYRGEFSPLRLPLLEGFADERCAPAALG